MADKIMVKKGGLFPTDWVEVTQDEILESSLIWAFSQNPDIQEMTLASGNLGMTWTYQKGKTEEIDKFLKERK